MASSKKSSASNDTPVDVHQLPIDLNQFLKLAGFGESGGALKERIRSGEVSLNGTVETRRGRKLADGDRVTLDGRTAVVHCV